MQPDVWFPGWDLGSGLCALQAQFLVLCNGEAEACVMVGVKGF